MRYSTFLALATMTCILIVLPVHAQTAGNLEFGFGSGLFSLETDGETGSFGLRSEAFVKKPFGNHLSVGLTVGVSKQDFGTQEAVFSTDLISGSVTAFYELMPYSWIDPFVSVGIGAVNFSVDNGPRYWDGDGSIGGGLFINLFGPFRAMLSGGYHFTTGDDFDGIRDGKPDNYFSVQAGFSFSLSGSQMFNQEPLVQPAAIEQVENNEVEMAEAVNVVEDETIEKYRKILEERLQELENELLVYSTMESELKKAIQTRDQLIKNLEAQVIKDDRP